MVIGIIGAGISGLVAGRLLAKAGHEVKIIEKSQGTGGKMATVTGGKNNDVKLDYGYSYFTANTEEFQPFFDELNEQKLITQWADHFGLFDGEDLFMKNPNRDHQHYYTAIDGMASIPEYLSRWVDVISEVKAGGLTYIGADRRKKRSWMINLTDMSVVEVDAVIIAAPATEALGVLQTAQDETAARKIMRYIDDVHYNPSFTLMATYGEMDIPDWKGIECESSDLSWIFNESSKGDNATGPALVAHSSSEFVKKHYNDDPGDVVELLKERLGDILGSWAATPEWTHLHHWKYLRARNTLNEYYLELEENDGPLALIGDYLMGNNLESSYISGYKLANHWIEKYKHSFEHDTQAKPIL